MTKRTSPNASLSCAALRKASVMATGPPTKIAGAVATRRGSSNSSLAGPDGRRAPLSVLLPMILLASSTSCRRQALRKAGKRRKNHVRIVVARHLGQVTATARGPLGQSFNGRQQEKHHRAPNVVTDPHRPGKSLRDLHHDCQPKHMVRRSPQQHLFCSAQQQQQQTIQSSRKKDLSSYHPKRRRRLEYMSRRKVDDFCAAQFLSTISACCTPLPDLDAGRTFGCCLVYPLYTSHQ
jgi:hypothetical protein